MATELKDLHGIPLTTEEAEAVFELWAKRQADAEALRSRLTVQDMAEAMAIPPDEVQRLLASVRSQRFNPPIQRPAGRVRPVNSLLIAIAAAVWILILVFACFFAYSSGWQNREFAEAPPLPNVNAGMPVPSSFDQPAIVSETTAPPEASYNLADLGTLFSSNLTVEFDEASIVGQGIPGQQRPLRAEVLLQVVDAVSPVPSAITSKKLSDAEIVKALRSGQDKSIEDLIQFKELTLRTTNGGGPLKEKIPVALTQKENIVRLVREEQLRRLNILANRAGQKLDL